MRSLRATAPENLERLENAELARLARQRHGDAFRLIMQRNPRLYRMARSTLDEDAEAADVVQQVYLVAFDQLAEFRAEARLWPRGGLGRPRRRRPSLELSVLDAPPRTNAQLIPFLQMPIHTDPERGAALKQIRQLIEQAIDELPDGFRAVFVMRDIEAMSVAETADVLALSPATVKTRLHRARRLLRRALDAQLASALSDTFPFDGDRCRQTTQTVLARLGLPPIPAG